MTGPTRFPRIAELEDLEALGRLLGPIASIEREAMTTPGFSGGSHQRLRLRLASGEARSLVLKTVSLADDWVAVRTRDAIGREAELLAEPALAPVWEAFDSSYLAFAHEPGRVGLLMRDLAAHLVPDARQPLEDQQEYALLDALAHLHARFWDSPALALPWLSSAEVGLSIIGPHAAAEMDGRDLEGTILPRVEKGWARAFEMLPAPIARRLDRPAHALAGEIADLPRTLIHGDAKVANFAWLPGGRVAAFDWAGLAAAPAGFELGWYLAVNASRLTSSKERLIERYRALLESRLGRRLEHRLWNRSIAAAVLAGARMLLWSKALATDSGTSESRAEWEWWVESLARHAP